MDKLSSIEEILDIAIDKLIGGADIQAILAEYPEAAEELRPMLETVVQLRQAPAPETDSSIQPLIRIIAKMANEAPSTKPKMVNFKSRKIVLRIAASIAIIFILGWGSISAATNTVPGDWFYPIKLLTEKVRFMLSVNNEKKVELKITYSTERLKELVAKYHSGDGLDRELLKVMLDEAQAALDDGQKLTTTTKPLLMKRISNMSHLQRNELKALQQTASPNDKMILEKSINLCGEMLQCCMRKSGNSSMNSNMSVKQQKMMQNCPMMDR
jgi:ABC-type multidrug transport system fused ATPase/permease subunit